MGGRAAEVVLYDNYCNIKNLTYNENILFPGIDNLEVTTGASNDLKQANSIARQYISLFGLGKKVGLYDNLGESSQPFLGRDITANDDKLSDYSKTQIDEEISELVEFAYESCLKIINKNKKEFNKIAELLLENKSIGGLQLKDIEINYL